MIVYELGNICHISTGQSAPQKSSAFGTEGNPFIRAGSLEKLISGNNEDTLELISNEKANQYRLKLFPKNTILFAKSGMSATLDRVYKTQGDCYVVSHLAAITPKNIVDSNYLLRWFQNNPPSRLIENSAYPSIKTSTIAKLKISLPPLEEQKRIAVILDKADAIRRKRKEAIKIADEFLRAVFLDMFGDPITNPKGWIKKSIYEVAPFAPNRQIKVSDDTKVWLLNLDQIESNTGKVISKHICEYTQVGNSTMWFDETHVLYCKLRPYLNKVVMPDSVGIATTELIPLKPNPNYLNREFLAMYLRSDGFVNWALNKVSGAKMPRLSTVELREHHIILPPLEIQKQFGSIFQKLLGVNKKYKLALNMGHENFESLSQMIFNKYT
jgi:type I restriction enzyme, S subunit